MIKTSQGENRDGADQSLVVSLIGGSRYDDCVVSFYHGRGGLILPFLQIKLYFIVFSILFYFTTCFSDKLQMTGESKSIKRQFLKQQKNVTKISQID